MSVSFVFRFFCHFGSKHMHRSDSICRCMFTHISRWLCLHRWLSHRIMPPSLSLRQQKRKACTIQVFLVLFF